MKWWHSWPPSLYFVVFLRSFEGKTGVDIHYSKRTQLQILVIKFSYDENFLKNLDTSTANMKQSKYFGQIHQNTKNWTKKLQKDKTMGWDEQPHPDNTMTTSLVTTQLDPLPVLCAHLRHTRSQHKIRLFRKSWFLWEFY